MKNIFVFIRRYFNFLFFLVLQILSISLLVRHSNAHEAAYAVVANEVTGRINTQYNKVENYLHLRENNRYLMEENARLKNLLSQNFEGGDTLKRTMVDTLVRDSLGRQRKYIYLPAKVVNNTIGEQLNYITLHRGANQGVRRDMAVVGSQGVVGSVIDVSDNYCRVMSLLNRNNKVSSMLKKSRIVGIVNWDGKDPDFVTLNGIPKSTRVAKGDTVVTSNYSANFPSDIMIGTIAEVLTEASNNSYIIRLKTATNFYSLEYAYLIDNVQWEEQRRLEAAPVKNQ